MQDDTEQLRKAQLQREQTEVEQVRSAVAGDDTAAHQRRADKARYLREKLDERARSERESEPDQD